MNTSTPALIAALYVIHNEEVTLCLKGHCEPTQSITIMHCGQDLRDYRIAGNETLSCLQVRDGDLLALIVRSNAEIIGCAIFEVQTAMSEVYGAVLAVKACADLLIDQLDADIVERGNQRSLEAIFAPTETAVMP